MVERGGLENRCALWAPGVRIPPSPHRLGRANRKTGLWFLATALAPLLRPATPAGAPSLKPAAIPTRFYDRPFKYLVRVAGALVPVEVTFAGEADGGEARLLVEAAARALKN